MKRNPKQRFDIDPVLQKISPHIPDKKIEFPFPPRNFNTRGRSKSYKTSQLYPAHILTLIKGLTSFNKVCSEFKSRRSFRDYCRFKNKNATPTNRILSEFRGRLNPSGFEEITRLITLTFLNTIKVPLIKVAVPDATDMPANCKGFVKKCTCTAVCECTKEYSAKEAAKGKRTKKGGQSPYFVGYKKHTLRLWLKIKSKNLMVPLVSFIAPANIDEGNFLSFMIQYNKNELFLYIDIIVVDMGYISSEKKMRLRKQLKTAVLTKVRENMQPPKEYLDYGCPECLEGIPLCWEGYDAETEMHCYKTPLDNPACDICWRHENCYQELYISPSIDEHHFGIIPLHTKVSQKLLQKIRPQVERGFENDKNKLYLNRCLVNCLMLANILGHLSDACQILILLGDMKTNTKSKAKKMMKRLYAQMNFDFN